MRKIRETICCIIVFCILVMVCDVTAFASGAGDFTVENGVLTKYTGSGGDVVIPGNLGIREIGLGAFHECTSLTSIVIPYGVSKVNDIAFMNCNNLSSIYIPDSVTTLGNSVFAYCPKLSSLSIPSSVTSVGVNICYRTPIPNPILINNGKILNYIPVNLSSYVIPSTVTEISAGAFVNCDKLSSITIPNSISRIQHETFCFCYGLTSITIPTSVTTIDYWAFEYCANLTSIIIPSNVISIAGGTDGAFIGCNNLTIYGYQGSYAQQYAAANNIKFKLITDNALAAPQISISSQNITPAGSAVVSWGSVAGAKSYDVVIKFGSTLNVGAYNTTSTSYTVSGLDEGSYMIYVIAEGETTCGPKSNTKILTVQQNDYHWYSQGASTEGGSWSVGDLTDAKYGAICKNISDQMRLLGCCLTSSAMVLTNLGATNTKTYEDIRNGGAKVSLTPDPFNLSYINYSVSGSFCFRDARTVQAFGYQINRESLSGNSQEKLDRISTLIEQHPEGVILKAVSPVNSEYTHFYVDVGTVTDLSGRVCDLIVYNTLYSKKIDAGENLEGVTLNSLNKAYNSSYYQGTCIGDYFVLDNVTAVDCFTPIG